MLAWLFSDASNNNRFSLQQLESGYGILFLIGALGFIEHGKTIIGFCILLAIGPFLYFLLKNILFPLINSFSSIMDHL